jgi:hypothetical protein
MRSNATEPKHLFYYDSLNCIACGNIIWQAIPHVHRVWKFSQIERAYWSHAKKCFGLKKLIVTQRKGYLNNAQKI